MGLGENGGRDGIGPAARMCLPPAEIGDRQDKVDWIGEGSLGGRCLLEETR